MSSATDSSQRHLDELFELLRFPSISTDSRHKNDVSACGQWLSDKLSGMGLATEIHQTPGHPVVVAKNDHRPERRTVLIYGHYDVQPVDPIELWTSPPFEPEIRNGMIWGRGSTDNKGQHFAHILGVEETLKANDGELPVNIIFALEGEEEIGSPNMEPFLKQHAADLACDVVAVSDTGMIGPGIPTMTYGLRGISCVEFVLRGPATDLHSGVYGGGVANPAMVAAQMAASLHDADGRVTIEGFYDKVQPLEGWEGEQWARVPDGEGSTKAETGVPELYGEAGFTSLERRWARPTAEINGIGGGYQGEGSKTVIPRQAMVKVSFRLVPDQDPQEIIQMARAHFEAICPSGVTMDFEEGHYGPAYLMDPFSDFGKAAQSALKLTFNANPMLIREGGSIPIIQSFKDVLGADSLMLGLALPDCQIHAPDENFAVENFEAGIRMNGALLEKLGE